jgi:DNA-binding MarR family transcriptional regulator
VTQPSVTRRQVETLRAVRDLTQPRGPTIRELGHALGVSSTCTVQRHVESLVRKGHLRRLPGARGIALTEAGQRALEEGG